MDHFKKLRRQIQIRVFAVIFFCQVVVIGSFWALAQFFELPVWVEFTGLVVFGCITALLTGAILARSVMSPLQSIWQAVMHVVPSHTGTPPPNIESLRLGRELVTSLSMQIYKLASNESLNEKNDSDHRKAIIQAASIVSHLPLPMFVFNKDQQIVNASDAAMSYCEMPSSELFGKKLFDSMFMEFPSEHTLDSWISECQESKATDTAYWERIRVRTAKKPDTVKQCDIAAYYNRDNPSGTEFIVTLFDRTERYNQDDESMSFVSLAVHELRTPLTMLRGYLEVLDDEVASSLNEEQHEVLNRMQVSADQLTNFVHNILNVAKIDNNQLTLHLSEGNWTETLNKYLDDIELRAKVNGKTIERHIAKDIPPAAFDPVSIQEVVINLVDNALKYSTNSNKIVVSSMVGKDGSIETTVQDFGLGIPESVLPNLFEKFYRNHRTRTQIGGTGLGLYLCKALISAHGGRVWAQSKEGEGSTFGFSLTPFSQLSEDQKAGKSDITRSAHGWIKNHSIYRR